MNDLAVRQSSALALPEQEVLQVLQSSLYPGADLDSIRMVLGYCKAAGLDPMQKPVHIVPMWDRQAGAMRDVIMPGVNLYRIQASRSGQYAGLSEPEFGPDVTATIGGQEITYPEWCKVTAKRQLANGAVGEFTAREFWLENYAVKGGKEKSIAPNAMWTKRPRGQIAKCATAQALRAAFPEIAGQYTAEELDGKEIYQEDDLGQKRYHGLTHERSKAIRTAAGVALAKFNVNDNKGAFEAVKDFTDQDEMQALWRCLKEHSDLRTAIKEEAAKARAAQEQGEQEIADASEVVEMKRAFGESP